MTPVDAILARLLALHPKKIDLSLDRMWRILERARPSRARACRRSSTSPAPTARARPSRSCARSWKRPGARVHVYTSPHLVRFNERFRLGAPGGGRLVADDELAGALAECERVNDERADHGVRDQDRGRLRAVRAPSGRRAAARSRPRRPARRHQRDRAAARHRHHAGLDRPRGVSSATTSRGSRAEKAGILKRGVPAVVAPQPREALRVIEREAARLSAPAQDRRRGLDGDRGARPPRLSGRATACSICRRRGCSAATSSTMPGSRSRRCARLPDLKLPPAAFEDGLAKVEWPARLQRLSHGRLAALRAGGQRAVARRRPQSRRRPRDRRRARRSRGARVAAAGPDRRHAVDQGQRRLPAQFRRAGPPRHRGADSRSGEERCRRTTIADVARDASACRPTAAPSIEEALAAVGRARARSAAAHPDHRLALSCRRGAGGERHAAG